MVWGLQCEWRASVANATTENDKCVARAPVNDRIPLNTLPEWWRRSAKERMNSDYSHMKISNFRNIVYYRMIHNCSQTTKQHNLKKTHSHAASWSYPFTLNEFVEETITQYDQNGRNTIRITVDITDVEKMPTPIMLMKTATHGRSRHSSIRSICLEDIRSKRQSVNGKYNPKETHSLYFWWMSTKSKEHFLTNVMSSLRPRRCFLNDVSNSVTVWCMIAGIIGTLLNMNMNNKSGGGA